MPQSSKARKSIKIPSGQAKKYSDAIALLSVQYAPLAEVWAQLTPRQKDGVLAHSPLLSQVLAFAAQFPRGDTWR